ncbi:MAG: hypothetical protein V1770_05030 [bacterium]
MEVKRLKREIEKNVTLLVPTQLREITIYSSKKGITPFFISSHERGYLGFVKGSSLYVITTACDKIRQIRILKIESYRIFLIIDGVRFKVNIIKKAVSRIK